MMKKPLPALVTYLLESKDWTCIWLSEYSEPMHLFTYKTGIPYREAKKYLDNAMDKLLGPVYQQTQMRLRRKLYDGNDLYFKPKRQHTNTRQPKKQIPPRTEFGKKYLQHYRLWGFRKPSSVSTRTKDIPNYRKMFVGT